MPPNNKKHRSEILDLTAVYVMCRDYPDLVGEDGGDGLVEGEFQCFRLFRTATF